MKTILEPGMSVFIIDTISQEEFEYRYIDTVVIRTETGDFKAVVRLHDIKENKPTFQGAAMFFSLVEDMSVFTEEFRDTAQKRLVLRRANWGL